MQMYLVAPHLPIALVPASGQFEPGDGVLLLVCLIPLGHSKLAFQQQPGRIRIKDEGDGIH